MPAPHAAFFTGEVTLSNGVYYLDLPNGNPFGYYSYLSDQNYIYHFDSGYEYVLDANDGKRGVYFYDFASGHWWYTGQQYPFPYIYDFSLSSFLYYYPDTANIGHYTTNPRYFYNFATQRIIALPDPNATAAVDIWLVDQGDGGATVYFGAADAASLNYIAANGPEIDFGPQPAGGNLLVCIIGPTSGGPPTGVPSGGMVGQCTVQNNAKQEVVYGAALTRTQAHWKKDGSVVKLGSVSWDDKTGASTTAKFDANLDPTTNTVSL